MAASMRAALNVAREEACLVSADALSARAAQSTVQHVVNPTAVRAAVKEASAETSILGQHLTSNSTNVLSSTTSTVQNALKDDLPTTLREAVSQATQAGVEEQGEKTFLTLKSATGMPIVPAPPAAAL